MAALLFTCETGLGCPLLDQKYSVVSASLVNPFSNSWIGQSFLIGRTGTLSRIETGLTKENGLTNDLYFLVARLNGAFLQSPPLAQLTIPNAAIPFYSNNTNNMMSIDLSSFRIRVSTGDHLVFLAKSDLSPIQQPKFDWVIGTDGGYKDGDFGGAPNDLSTFQADGRFDLGFRTYVDVTNLPCVVLDPQSQVVAAGTNITLSATVGGTPPFSYRWQMASEDLPGATNAILRLTNVQPRDSGDYRVVVTNPFGMATSAVARLTVMYSLTLITNGSGQVTRVPDALFYSPGLGVTLRATANADAVFGSWTGDVIDDTNPLGITMTTNKTIVANFTPKVFVLEVVGSGTVIKSPDQAIYNIGDHVMLTAMPGRWHAFTRWDDGLANNPRVISVGITNRYTAIFSPTTAVETLTFGTVSRLAPVGMPAIFVDGEFAVTGAVTRLGSAAIALRTTFPNGTILYTLDGTQPSFLSRLYTGPLSLTHSARIRALAYNNDFTTAWEADPMELTIVPVYSLSASSVGGGAITVSPTNAPYASNTLATVQATPDAGWTFLQWLGDVTGIEALTIFGMTRDKCVQAVFGTKLNTTITGSGSVWVDPVVVVSGFYPYGSTVKLTAVPQAGNFFALWGNAGRGTNNPLRFVVTNANQSVSCLFAGLPLGQSALTVVASGAGRVAANPKGSRFNTGQTISLTAIPDLLQEFTGWSGDANGTQNLLTISLDQSKVITANFTRHPQLSTGNCLGGIREGGFQLTLSGELEARYQIERSADLINWAVLAYLTNSSGRGQFTDATATNLAGGFYRATPVP